MSHRTLVLGGARSGKSAYAEGLLPTDRPISYLATARRDPTDAEWEARIAAHAARRPPTWQTVETTGKASLATWLRTSASAASSVLVDDVATWLTNVMDDAGAWDGGAAALASVGHRADELIAAVAGCPVPVVLVSAEVGLGVVPQIRSGRLFRDELGSLNARLAEVCDEVVLLVAGIPMKLR